jgi:potassium-transporting ATPase KdpC subunit
MKTHLVPCLKITLITIILFGVVYPLAITGIAKISAPNDGEGATIEIDGKLVGFEVIGQSFVSDKYFNSRPSAVGYNAAATGGSNKGPTNPDYLAQVEERITNFLKQNPDVKREDIPVDLVTASGGGLDPHISVQAALVQVPRIARQRGMDVVELKALVIESTEEPLWNLFGPKKVNVLKLNLALDKLK